MSEAPIGILDSGSGGLSIWLSIANRMPKESFIYVGDHAYLPYGDKTTSWIRNRVFQIINFLQSKNVKLVVVACNTATVAGIDVYRKTFPSVPIIGVVPVVKTAAKISKKKKFAVLSTQYTAQSQYQKDLINRFACDCTVYNIGCPDLISWVERGAIDGISMEKRLRALMKSVLSESVDVIALGCTHYPFLRNQFRAIVGDGIQILDSGAAVARHVERILKKIEKQANRHGKPKYDFFTTGKANVVSAVASQLTKTSIHFYDATI